MENLRISRREACEILSISTETASKWIKLVKLKMNDDKTFDKKYVERLAEVEEFICFFDVRKAF